jgi:hypothetical protein
MIGHSEPCGDGGMRNSILHGTRRRWRRIPRWWRWVAPRWWGRRISRRRGRRISGWRWRNADILGRRIHGWLAAAISRAPGNRHLVTFGIHALNIRAVVTVLSTVCRPFRSASTSRTPDQQSGAGTHSRTVVSAKCRAGRSADHRTHDGTGDPGLVCRLACAAAADLRLGVISAVGVVRPELIEILPTSGQHSGGRPRRHGYASPKYKQRCQCRERRSILHGVDLSWR